MMYKFLFIFQIPFVYHPSSSHTHTKKSKIETLTAVAYFRPAISTRKSIHRFSPSLINYMFPLNSPIIMIPPFLECVCRKPNQWGRICSKRLDHISQFICSYIYYIYNQRPNSCCVVSISHHEPTPYQHTGVDKWHPSHKYPASPCSENVSQLSTTKSHLPLLAQADADENRHWFGKPKRDSVVVLGECWNANPFDVTRQAMRSGGSPNNSDAYTINGQPGDLYNCSTKETVIVPVDSGETNLIRVINADLNQQLFLSIAKP